MSGVKGKTGKYKRTEETKKRMSLVAIGKKGTNTGRSFTKEWKEKISNTLKGHIVSEESRLKMSNKARLRIGEKATNWQGGISFEPYSVDWKETLKRAIRERDNYICQKCSRYGNCVHHIDYNKMNCNVDNLITTCRGCNSRVNKNKEFWKEYFTNLLKGRGKV